MFKFALHEIRQIRRADSKTVLFLVVFLFIAALAVYASFTFQADEKVYSVNADGELADILQQSPRLEIVDGDADVVVSDSVNIKTTQKGRAAFKNILDTLDAHNRAVLDSMYADDMIDYYDIYPVWAKLLDMEDLPEIEEVTQDTIKDDIAELRVQRAGYRGTTDVRGAFENAMTQTKYNELSTPDQLDRLFPIRSIIISLLIITPIIFLTTAYNNSFFNEKLQKKATLLFVAPLKGRTIIISKSMPYVGAALAIILPMIAYFNHELKVLFMVLLPLLSIILLYFSVNFLLTVLARSYKEISFLKTSLGSVFIAYILLPTLFLEMSDIAFISPLSSIVALIDNSELGIKIYLWSFLPMLFTSVVVYYFASLLFDEEHFYSDKGMLSKMLDMISVFIRRPIHISYLTLLSFPLVLVIELIFLMLVALPTRDVNFLFIMLILVAATVEELFKNIGIYLVYTRKLLDISVWKLALFSGVAFALAEKSLLIAMLPALLDSYSRIVPPGILLPALIVPFIFHSLTCLVFGSLAKKTRNVLIFAVPIFIHIVYNLIIFRVFT